MNPVIKERAETKSKSRNQLHCSCSWSPCVLFYAKYELTSPFFPRGKKEELSPNTDRKRYRPLYVSSFWILGQQPSFLSLQRFRILAMHCHPLRTALSSSASRWPEMMRVGSSFAIDGTCGYRSSCQGAASSLPRDHDVAATLCGYVAVTPCLVLARTHGGPYLKIHQGHQRNSQNHHPATWQRQSQAKTSNTLASPFQGEPSKRHRPAPIRP